MTNAARSRSLFGPGLSGALSLLCAPLFLGCAPSGPGEITYATGRTAGETADGLYRVDSPFGVSAKVFVRPGASLEEYDQVMLDPVRVRYLRSSSRQLDAESQEILEARFEDALKKQLEKSEVYTLVESAGPRVLRVQASIVDLEVTAPPDTAPTAQTAVFLSSAGAMTGLLEISDSRSHQALVRAADRQRVSDVAGTIIENSSTANLGDASVLFRHWALKLRGWLDHVRDIPPLPEGISEK
jgi:hypothetical protein